MSRWLVGSSSSSRSASVTSAAPSATRRCSPPDSVPTTRVQADVPQAQPGQHAAHRTVGRPDVLGVAEGVQHGVLDGAVRPAGRCSATRTRPWCRAGWTPGRCPAASQTGEQSQQRASCPTRSGRARRSGRRSARRARPASSTVRTPCVTLAASTLTRLAISAGSRAGRPTTRAPGAGPDATRHRPAGARTRRARAATRAGRLGVGAEQRHRRARSRTPRRPSAPAASPARSVRRRPGCSEMAAGCRSLPSAAATAAGSPLASAASMSVDRHRPAAGRPGSARAAGRARRTPSGVDRPSLGQREHPVQRRAGQHRRQQVAAAGADRGAAGQRERHVRADLGADLRPARRAPCPAPTAPRSRRERLPRRRFRRPCRRPPGSAWRSRWRPGRRRRCAWPAAGRPRRPGSWRRPARRRPGWCAPSAGRPAAMVSSSARSTAWNTVTRSW